MHQVLSDPLDAVRFGVEIVHGDVEEPLDLRGVQVHCDDVIATGRLKHIRHEFCGNGRPRLILLVLSRIGKVGKDGSNAPGGGSLAGVADDEKFHEAIVDVVGPGGLKDEDYDNPSALETCPRQCRKTTKVALEQQIPSSSRTDSPIVTLVSWFEYCRTIIFTSSIPNLVKGRPSQHMLFSPSVSRGPRSRRTVETNLLATARASSGWLLPVNSLMEFDDMPSAQYKEDDATEDAFCRADGRAEG